MSRPATLKGIGLLGVSRPHAFSFPIFHSSFTIQDVNILIARSDEDIETAYDNLFSSNLIGCDTETSGLSAATSKLFSVQFSDSEFHCLVPTSEGIALGKLAGILSNDSITKIFHNARFDLAFLNANGYTVSNVFDTMVAEKVLTKGANQSVSLAETLYRYFAIDLDKSQRKKFGRSWNRIWTPELVDYAMNDVAYLPELMNRQIKWMEELGLTSQYVEKIKRITDQ
jgi:ribonuclease D